VNGIIGIGCRVFYGVKAVRFILASHSQLKYGARLINSYLGNNSTISCCEVLNSLIFPAHEQHHNNSFLCAALVMGQSNMAAGATIGSNHNSRSPDGEIIAGRGFWPGLCVSLKHNSKFASFIILAKGDYPAELNIPIPFYLISNDVSKDELVIMTAYWLLYNMYEMVRNSWKYANLDKLIDRTQPLEYEWLSPDSINEIIDALPLLSLFTGKAYSKKFEPGSHYADEELISLGKNLLDSHNPVVEELDIHADGFENSERKVRLVKVAQAWQIFMDLINFYAVNLILEEIKSHRIKSFDALLQSIPGRLSRQEWNNVGGQLITKSALDKFIGQIHKGSVKNWEQVHRFYQKQGEQYAEDKFIHAMSAVQSSMDVPVKKMSKLHFRSMLLQDMATKEWMTKGIYDSRAKDYSNPFRKMVYESIEEMKIVVGSLEENSFVNDEIAALKSFRKEAQDLIKKFKL
jgi:hypothetical protein